MRKIHLIQAKKVQISAIRFSLSDEIKRRLTDVITGDGIQIA